MSDNVGDTTPNSVAPEEVRTRNEWGWKEFVDDLYKKVIPKLYSRLAKLEAEVAKNRISVD